jgi:hypothetical protein
LADFSIEPADVYFETVSFVQAWVVLNVRLLVFLGKRLFQFLFLVVKKHFASFEPYIDSLLEPFVCLPRPGSALRQLFRGTKQLFGQIQHGFHWFQFDCLDVRCFALTAFVLARKRTQTDKPRQEFATVYVRHRFFKVVDV